MTDTLFVNNLTTEMIWRNENTCFRDNKMP